MIDTNEEIVISIKKRPDWFILFGFGGILLVAPVFIGNVIFGILTHKYQIDRISLIFISSFISIFTLIVIKIFLWHYRGKEKITIDKKELKLEKIGSILDFPGNYKLEKIETFSLAKKRKFEKFFDSYGLKGGEIQFEYYGEIIKFGQSLTRKEAKEIINQLNKHKNNEPLTNAIANAGFRVR